MSTVWVVGNNDLAYIADHKPLKVFKDKEEADAYLATQPIWDTSMAEAEMVYVEGHSAPRPPSKFKCANCGQRRDSVYDVFLPNYIANDITDVWCDNCKKLTESIEYLQVIAND